MRHPHDAGTQADSRRVRSAGQSWEVRSTEQATRLSGTPSAPSARTKQALEYTFSGGYAMSPDMRLCREIPTRGFAATSGWAYTQGSP